MSDSRKTKKELSAEVDALRRKLARMESLKKARVISEDTLRLSEEKFSKVFHYSPEEISILTYEDGRYIDINEAFIHTTGYSREEIIGKTPAELNLWCTAQDSKRFFKLFENNGRLNNIEFSFRIRSGEIRTVLISAETIFYNNRKCVITISRDISDFLQAQKKLQESEERYRRITEAVTDYIFTVFIEDGRAARTVHGSACIAVTGYASREFADDPYLWIHMVHPEDRDIVNRQARDILNKSIYPIEHRIIRKDGSIRWVRNTPVPHSDASGSLVSYDGLIHDITDWRIAEDSLKLTQYSIDNASASIFWFGRDTKFVYVNETACRVLGYSREEMLSMTVFDIDIEYPKEKWAQHWELMKERKGVGFESKHRARDGRIFPVEITANYLEYEGREYVFCFVYDISKRKAAEEKYKQLIESIHEAVYSIDSQGTITFMSPGIQDMMGYSPEELTGKNFTQFVLAQDLPGLMDSFLRTMKGAWEPYEFRVMDKYGAVRYIRTSSTPLLENGQPVGLNGVITDITSIRLSEKILASEKERLAVTLRSIGDGVISTDTNGYITLINRAAEKITGWNQEDAVGRALDEVLRLSDIDTGRTIGNLVKGIIDSGEIFMHTGAMRLIARDGTERIIDDSGAAVRDMESVVIGVVIVFRDITEKQRIEEELFNARKLESLGLLAGGIAHDYNNILTAILGNINLAKMYAAENKEQEDLLAEAEKASLVARELTQQLLTFSKGGAPIKSAASMDELLRDTAAFALRGSNVVCEFDIPEGLWQVEIDEAQISQVINNLVINAQQAMPSGGIIRLSAENVDAKTAPDDSVLPPGRYIKISVRDEGVGIPQELLSRVFDPYFTTKPNGSGLGLTTSYSIIRRHGGFISVSSEAGKGSTFYFYLPMTSTGAARKARSAPGVIRGKGRVLVMDDDAMVRSVALRMLAELGFDAEGANDGRKALEMYKEARDGGAPFDAVIMDLTVPAGMGGREMIERLRAIDPAVKAIVSSGYSNDPVMAEFARYGFSGMVMKPYRIEDLSAMLHQVLKVQRQ